MSQTPTVGKQIIFPVRSARLAMNQSGMFPRCTTGVERTNCLHYEDVLMLYMLTTAVSVLGDWT